MILNTRSRFYGSERRHDISYPLVPGHKKANGEIAKFGYLPFRGIAFALNRVKFKSGPKTAKKNSTPEIR